MIWATDTLFKKMDQLPIVTIEASFLNVMPLYNGMMLLDFH